MNRYEREFQLFHFENVKKVNIDRIVRRVQFEIVQTDRIKHTKNR